MYFQKKIYKNMKMAIWHVTTHFVVEGHICASAKPERK